MNQPSSITPPARTARWIVVIAAVVLVAAAVLIWRYSPLAEWASADRITVWMEQFKGSVWAPLIVIGVFVIGGLIAFPLTLLITAAAVLFEPWIAIATSLAGALASAATLYAIGRLLVGNLIRTAFGAQVETIRRALENRGVVAVATIRMMPIAPFTLVNLAAGSIAVRLRDYLIGTALGVLPGTVALTVFGGQLREIFARPTLANVALLVAAIGGWIALSLSLQSWVTRYNRSREQ